MKGEPRQSSHKADSQRISVFLSYARVDQPLADKFATALAGHGFDIWWDKLLGSGESYGDRIEAQLNAVDAVIVLWTAHSARSNWVRDEAAMGRDRDVLVPVRVARAQPPLGFRQIQSCKTVAEVPAAAEIGAVVEAVHAIVGRAHAASDLPPPAIETGPAPRPRSRGRLLVPLAGAVAAMAYGGWQAHRATRSRRMRLAPRQPDADS
jgi:hypothetical protein